MIRNYCYHCKKNKGEGYWDAALRELKEEVGVELESEELDLFKSYLFEQGSKVLNIFVFLHEDNKGSFDIEGFRGPGELLDNGKLTLPNNQSIIQDVLKYFQTFRAG